MIESILTAVPPQPDYLHRHILQLYLIKHRRPPRDEAERRRAVYEYLTRGRRKDEGRPMPVLESPALSAWLCAPDERVRGWGPVPRLAALIHQHGRDLRKRYDLEVERDYKEFACYLALGVASALGWPESFVDESLRRVLWESAPGTPSGSRLGVTRALRYVRRVAPKAKQFDLAKPADYAQLLLRVLGEIDEGNMPSYALSPEQFEALASPVHVRGAKLALTGLLHHLIVERGLVKEADLTRPDVAETVRREVPGLLARLRLPSPLREAHAGWLGRPAASVTELVQPRVPMVTVVGPLSHGSGLGAATRATVEALKAADLPAEVLNHVAGWGRTDEDEGAEKRSTIRGDVNILHFNPDVLIENLAQFGLEQFEGRYNIGFFFWETSKACLAHRLGADLVDEIWVSSEYCRSIFAPVTDKPVVVVGTPVPKIEDVSWANRRAFGLPEDRFTFVFTFDGASRFTRKNPLATVRAFQQAFPGDDGVQLVVKTHNTEWLTSADERTYAELRRAARADRRIVVIDESFTSNEVHALISVSDCYVALHRSEGLGLGMAEAMKLRVPVIATGYSGNADFTTEATSWPVRVSLVPVPPRDFVYEEDGQVWADPDVDHAAMRMLEVRTGADRDARVRRAAELVKERYDVAVIGRAYRERIEAIRAGLASPSERVRITA